MGYDYVNFILESDAAPGKLPLKHWQVITALIWQIKLVNRWVKGWQLHAFGP